MLSYDFMPDEIVEIDLHRKKSWEAWLYLDEKIASIPEGIKEIIVIHGYHRGCELLTMVRQNYSHDRVKRKFLGMNQGRTSLILV